jgi:hypothetical protein
VSAGAYVLQYDVVTTGPMSDAELVQDAAMSWPHPLPSKGQTYSLRGEADANSTARDFTVESCGENRYRVTVHYFPTCPIEPALT